MAHLVWRTGARRLAGDARPPRQATASQAPPQGGVARRAATHGGQGSPPPYPSLDPLVGGPPPTLQRGQLRGTLRQTASEDESSEGPEQNTAGERHPPLPPGGPADGGGIAAVLLGGGGISAVCRPPWAKKITGSEGGPWPLSPSKGSLAVGRFLQLRAQMSQLDNILEDVDAVMPSPTTSPPTNEAAEDSPPPDDGSGEATETQAAANPVSSAAPPPGEAP